MDVYFDFGWSDILRGCFDERKIYPHFYYQPTLHRFYFLFELQIYHLHVMTKSDLLELKIRSKDFDSLAAYHRT